MTRLPSTEPVTPTVSVAEPYDPWLARGRLPLEHYEEQVRVRVRAAMGVERACFVVTSPIGTPNYVIAQTS